MDRFNEFFGRFFREISTRGFLLLGVGILVVVGLVAVSAPPPSFWLQLRINRAKPGATITLKSKDYCGEVLIAKPLILAGRHPGASCELDVVISGVNEPRVTIRDLTLEFSDLDCHGTACVRLERVSMTGGGLEIRGTAEVFASECLFTDGWDGTVVAGEGRLEATDCEWSHTRGTGILVRNHGTLDLYDCRIREHKEYGVLLREDAVATMRRTAILANGEGSAARVGYAPLTNVLLHQWGSGIWAMSRAVLRFSDGSISYNARNGIAAFHEASVELLQVEIVQNGETGVLLLSSSNHSLEGCFLKKNGGYGLFLAAAGDVLLNDSEIESNQGGGLATYDAACFGREIEYADPFMFEGSISGSGNRIGRSDTVDEDAITDCCPASLCDFLNVPGESG